MKRYSKEWESFSVMLADHYTTVKTEEVLHDLASEKLKDVYPQLACLASLGLTIPFSTADCERAFSSMKRVNEDVTKEQTENVYIGLSFEDQY